MKRNHKRLLSYLLILAFLVGYLPAGNGAVANAEENSQTTEKETLQFGDTDTYLQLEKSLSTSPNAIEATVNMPEKQTAWTIVDAKDISVSNGTVIHDTMKKRVENSPMIGADYAKITIPANEELVFSKTFDDVQIPYIYGNDDVSLTFKVYSDKAVTINSGYIELTSSGTYDQNEICWIFSNEGKNVTLAEGWNLVTLPLKDMVNGSGKDAAFDLQNVNFFRWHSTTFSAETTLWLSDMKLVTEPEDDVDETLLIAASEYSSGKDKEVFEVKEDTVNGETFRYIEQKTFTQNATVRTDISQSAICSNDYTGLTEDNLAIVFWLKSDIDTQFNLDGDHFLKLGTDTYFGGNSPTVAFASGIPIKLQAGTWTKIVLPLKLATKSNAWTVDKGFTWMRLFFNNQSENVTYSISDMRIVDMVEEGIAASACTYTFAGGRYFPVSSDICDGEVFCYKEEVAYDNSSNNSGAWRCDFNNNKLFGIDLTGKDLSNYAVEFWMRSNEERTITLNDSNFLKLTGTTDSPMFNSGSIVLRKDEWTKVSFNLGSTSVTSASTFTNMRFLIQGLSEGSKIAVSDMKIVEVKEDNVIAAAEKHYSNNTNTMLDAVSVATLPNGQSINYRTYVTNKKSEIDIANRSVLKNFYNVELNNYAISFWMRASVDKNVTLNGSNKVLMFVTGNAEHIFKITSGSVPLKANEWTKVTLKLSDNNITESNQEKWDYVRLLIRELGSNETYDISDMTLDYVETLESTAYTSGKNYMVFSNLDGAATANQSAMLVTEDGYPAVVWNGTQYTLKKNICTGEDVTLKVIRDSKGFLNLYVNDTLEGRSAETTTALSVPTTVHCIGADANGKGVMNGSISNVKVYSDETMQTCIGSWELKGNIEQVTATMEDTSSEKNHAVFKGSRADDWSDYTIPTEVSDVVGTVVTAKQLSYGIAGSTEGKTVIQDAGEDISLSYRTGTTYNEDSAYSYNTYRFNYINNNFDKYDLSGYGTLDQLAIEFWMKIEDDLLTSLPTAGTNHWIKLGKDQSNCLQFGLSDIVLNAGTWTKVVLPLKDAGTVGEWTQSEGFSCMRFLVEGFTGETQVSVSDVKLVKIGEEASYSIVYVPDICNLTNASHAATWNTMAQWIADHAETANIQHVIMSGNNTKDNSETSYAYAMSGIEKFKDKVSWSTTIGYYDAEYPGNNTARDTSEYSQFVSETVMKQSKPTKETYGGCYVDAENKKHTENAYYRFDVNGVKWMILQLEYKPSDAVITWAKSILDEYTLDNVILSTPAFLTEYGQQQSFAKEESELYKLTANSNVKLVLCSHADNRTGAVVQTTVNDVPVLMMNASDLDDGANAYYSDRALGMIGILRFSADGENVALQYYSPSEGMSFTPEDPWGKEESNSIVLELNPQTCTPVVRQYENATAGTAPTENVPKGYVFAGWFTDETCQAALAKDQSSTNAYAKFVDAEMLTVKAQVKLADDNTNLPSDKTDIRFITSLDSLRYAGVGLKVKVAGKEFNTMDTTSVYKKLRYIDKIGTETQSMEITPHEAFSPYSVYFKALTIQNVPNGNYNSEFLVTPYWVTLDGTTVEGKQTTKKISDGAVASGETQPQVMTTANATDDVVVADIVPTTMGYAVDKTGVMDSTAGIQTALYDCYNAGGGTVFLPAGTYKISEEIHIPSYVTLRGDYDDADSVATSVAQGVKKKISGTVLSICVESEDSDATGTIQLSGSSGVVGVTVYYPEQTSLQNVKPYPYTFYVPTHAKGTRAVTLRDITVLNGYRGVATRADLNHESLTVDNVKGTFLHTGFSLRNQSDAGMVNDVTVSSEYWLTAELNGLSSVDKSDLENYMKCYTVGIQAEGLEWTAFQNITVEGCHTGIRFDKGIRLLTGWTNYPDSGLLAVSMMNVKVTDCTQGLYVSEQGLDSRWGSVITHSTIEGSITNLSDGTLKLTDVKVDDDALTDCKNVKVCAGEITADTGETRAYKPKKTTLYVADLPKGTSAEVSSDLQTILDKAGNDGGGIVYVPGGTYRLDGKLDVPKGVELRGVSAVANREQWIQNGGTVFLCYYGDDVTANPEEDDAFITLQEGAGLNGIRILYPENGADKENRTTTYTVKARAKDVYVVNCCIMASGYGVDFRACDNHLVKGLNTGCWYQTFCLGGENGYLMNCLHNGTVIHRTHADGLPEVWGDAAAPNGSVGDMLRAEASYIRLENAKNQKIISVTACSIVTMIDSVGSTGTVAINVATDKMKTNSYQFSIDSGNMTVINAMRHPGNSYAEPTENGTLKLYGRIAIGNVNEDSKNE